MGDAVHVLGIIGGIVVFLIVVVMIVALAAGIWAMRRWGKRG